MREILIVLVVSLILMIPAVRAAETGIVGGFFNGLGYIAGNTISLIKVAFISMSAWISKHIMRNPEAAETAERDVQREIALNSLNNDRLSNPDCCRAARCHIYPSTPCTQTCVDCQNAEEEIKAYFG